MKFYLDYKEEITYNLGMFIQLKTTPKTDFTHLNRSE